MISGRTFFISTVAMLVATVSATSAESPDDIRIRLFQQTKIAAVMSLSGPANGYKDDGDPNTLEIVFLEKKSDGPSRVSENGEVIFLYKASDKTQQKMIQKAFDIRVARALSGT